MKHSRAMSLLPKIELSPSFLRIRLPVKTVLPLPDHQDFLFPMVEQGITTVVIGNCGFSPAPITAEGKKIINDLTGPLLDRPLSYEWETMDEFFKPDMFQPVVPLPQDSQAYRRRTGSGVSGTKFTPYLQRWGSFHEKIEVTDEASWSFGNRMHDDFFLCGTATFKYRYPQRPPGGLSVQTQLCQQPGGR